MNRWNNRGYTTISATGILNAIQFVTFRRERSRGNARNKFTGAFETSRRNEIQQRALICKERITGKTGSRFNYNARQRTAGTRRKSAPAIPIPSARRLRARGHGLRAGKFVNKLRIFNGNSREYMCCFNKARKRRFTNVLITSPFNTRLCFRRRRKTPSASAVPPTRHSKTMRPLYNYFAANADAHAN